MNENARPAANGTGAKLADEATASVPPPADLPNGRAQAGPPCPGRRLWVVAVPRCPRCQGMHVHRVGEAARLLSGRVIRCCPTTGRAYRLAPVQRRREARRAS